MQELDLIYGRPAEQAVQHGIRFGNFDSLRFRLHQHDRTAITPTEKEVTANIPYAQGVVDMSGLLGNRIYANRAITYVFYRFGVHTHPPEARNPRRHHSSHTARDFQTTIENLLMVGFDQELIDSYEPDFHYIGKCREVIVEDEYSRNRLRVQITFDLYPFKIANHTESEDLFDPFNFDLDAFHNGLSYTISGSQRLLLYNASQKVLMPLVRVGGGGLTLQNQEGMASPITLEPGAAQTYRTFRLWLGMNTIDLHGSGTVWFDWRKERI
jgi:hypothetical protein